MTVTDFTEMLRKVELPSRAPIFEKVSKKDLIPDCEVVVYQSLDSSDYYYATRESCVLVGFCANWLHVALQRRSTVDELKRLGFETPLRQIIVKMGRIKKPVMALTRTDFMALIEYAKDAGNEKAIKLYRTFQILGLNQIAGITHDPEMVKTIYEQVNLTKD